jgi:hypothetical protein
VTKIVVPKHPKDGHQITFWTFNSHRDGLVQVRWTFVKNKPCWDVCDPDHTSEFYKRGLPFENQWYIENRYVPGMKGENTPWNGTGRNDHSDDLVIDETRFENCFATFAEARKELVVRLATEVDRLRNEAGVLHATRLRLFAMAEPA